MTNNRLVDLSLLPHAQLGIGPQRLVERQVGRLQHDKFPASFEVGNHACSNEHFSRHRSDGNASDLCEPLSGLRVFCWVCSDSGRRGIRRGPGISVSRRIHYEHRGREAVGAGIGANARTGCPGYAAPRYANSRELECLLRGEQERGRLRLLPRSLIREHLGMGQLRRFPHSLRRPSRSSIITMPSC
jgi:hypothetical protein